MNLDLFAALTEFVKDAHHLELSKMGAHQNESIKHDDLSNSNFWDEWDGQPTAYLSIHDINRLRKKHGLSTDDCATFFKLTAEQRADKRTAFEIESYIQRHFNMNSDDDLINDDELMIRRPKK